MPQVLNRFYHVSVLNLSQDTVDANAHYLDSHYEVLMKLKTGANDYRVREAKVEVMRNPFGQDRNVNKTLGTLSGLVAYKGIAKEILTATASDPTGLWASLLFECVKVLRQARQFIWHKTGFDPLPLRSLIERDFKDSCIYFSTPESINTILDPKQLKEQTREDLLFARYRYSFLEQSNYTLRATAGLSDSYHEMKLTTEIENGKITSSNAQIIRAPEEICFQTMANAANLLNCTIKDPPQKWERELLGPTSCTHLGDLAREIISSIDYQERVRQIIKPMGKTVPGSC